MSIERRQLEIQGMQVFVVRKAIKNLHLGVYPPNGRVRVAAPLAVSDDAVRLAVIDKFSWIKRQKVKFEAQPRQSQREMVNGESHYVWGKRYRLRVIDHDAPAEVIIRNKSLLELHVRPNMTSVRREKVLLCWYRERLKERIPPLLEKWLSVLNVQLDDWRVRKMKTRWGSCSRETRCIVLNLELAKKPEQCLEFILIHELIHLIERNHTDRFMALMDKHLPSWRFHRTVLNTAPLTHETWRY